MKKIDKIIFIVLILLFVLLFVYGFGSNTAFVIAVTGAALKIADLGIGFWVILGILLITLLLLIRYRNKN